uniref:DDE Tnp4 domain-containing protein n=1 Tax=Caenorhabditis japonica TaxID=281687 RepID=A0A8R1E7N7_CAEJA
MSSAFHQLMKYREDSVVGLTRKATFQFYSRKISFLFEHGHISEVVGVSDNVFGHLLTICNHGDSKCSAILRLAIFLKFCREGTSENALAKDVGLSQPTVNRIVARCIDDLVNAAPEYIRWPETKDEVRRMQNAFLNLQDPSGRSRNIPCFGLLDGKHWRCQHPPRTGSLNFNYKGFFSFNSLFVTDAEHRIIYIQMSELGVNSDAQMFRSGPLDTLLQKASEVAGVRKVPGSDTVMPSFILADNGFGLSKFVMTPYRENQLKSTKDIKYNEKISSVRVKVENLFGILVSKFQVFNRELRLDPKRSRALIISCCVIHNISIGAPSPPVVSDDEEVIIDPYKCAESQRTALKNHLLRV